MRSAPLEARLGWALAVMGALLVLGFDVLGPNLAYNDDWGFAWTAWHIGLSGIRTYPDSSALALPQVLLGALVSFGHQDRRLLRVTILPFAVAVAWLTTRLARRLGADAGWTAVAAAAPFAFPVFATDATSFMSDVPYVAFELGAVLAMLAWLERPTGRMLAAAAALTVLATLQRQIGVLLPLALAAAILAQPAIRRRWTAWAGAGTTAAAALAALAAASAVGIAPPTQGNRVAAILHQDPLYIASPFMFAAPVVGLGLVAFLPALLRGAPRPSHVDPRRLVIVVLGAWEGLLAVLAHGYVLPGNLVTAWSFAWSWTRISGAKPWIFPLPALLPIEVLAVATALLLVWQLGRLSAPGGSAVLLGAVAVTQFVPLLTVHYLLLDRYLLPVIAPLVPLVAAAATGAGVARLRVALVLLAGGLVMYAVGQQDYGAWQEARDQAARLAYAMAPPQEVHAGYEANAVYIEIPTYERTGQIQGSLADPTRRDTTLEGPAHPALRLLFAPPDDPRPGFTYRSIAPGKVVVARGDASR